MELVIDFESRSPIDIKKCGMYIYWQNPYTEVMMLSVRRKLRLTSDSKDCERPGPVNGHWRDADWLFCRDGKWRPTQSIVVEMADGLADRLGYSRFGDRWSLNPLIQKAENRVGRLKGYGNAINAEQAKAFIEAYMETI